MNELDSVIGYVPRSGQRDIIPVNEIRNSMFKTRFIRALALACAVFPHLGAQAQAFPDRPVTIVVAFAAGSPVDLTARALAAEMSLNLKQPVLVENRVGGSQIVAATSVARAPATGHTVMLYVLPSVTAPSAQANLPYKGIADFAPVARVSTIVGVLAVAPGIPANNLREFIDLLKANPGKYSYGTTGVGSALHLFVEKFHAAIGGAKAIHVPYRSVQPAMTDMMENRLGYTFAPMTAMEYVKAGKLKAIALPTLRGDPAYPSVPTFEASGLKGFEAMVTYALVTTKGTPPAVLERLNSAANAATATESFQSRMKGLGGVQISPPLTSPEAGTFFAQEEERWNALVKAQNIVLE